MEESVETEVPQIEAIDNQEVSQEGGSTELPKKYDKEEFAYLKNAGFSSEIFKVEIKNLPKYYGYSEIKKLINSTLNLESNKIKIPRKNSPFGFICFKNDEGLCSQRVNIQLFSQMFTFRSRQSNYSAQRIQMERELVEGSLRKSRSRPFSNEKKTREQKRKLS